MKSDDEHNRAGVVFNIQRYSIHDGPGIRTTVFLKGCPLRCFWCQNPESQQREPEIFLKKHLCILCGQCTEVCPTGAAGLSSEGSSIDRNLCIGCGECAAVCPTGARQLVGRNITVDDVMSEVLKDVKFYRKSGGGVTLSGGDPVYQPEFSFELLKRSKEANLHTVIDTAGFASWEILSKLLKYADFVLYDIKCIDEKKHYSGMKVSNRLILENAKKIYKSKKKMLIRVPLIPGFNDSVEEIESIARFVHSELEGTEIELLPYNKWGESKYEYLGREAYGGQTQSEEVVSKLTSNCKSERVKA